MTGIESSFLTLQSKEKPIRVTFKCSDKKNRYFLLKLETSVEVKKEENTMNCITFFNQILEDAGYELSSYTIIGLTQRMGLIEWVEDTQTIMSKGFFL